MLPAIPVYGTVNAGKDARLKHIRFITPYGRKAGSAICGNTWSIRAWRIKQKNSKTLGGGPDYASDGFCRKNQYAGTAVPSF
jgi:hypothetical protein